MFFLFFIHMMCNWLTFKWKQRQSMPPREWIFSNARFIVLLIFERSKCHPSSKWFLKLCNDCKMTMTSRLIKRLLGDELGNNSFMKMVFFCHYMHFAQGLLFSTTRYTINLCSLVLYCWSLCQSHSMTHEWSLFKANIILFPHENF